MHTPPPLSPAFTPWAYVMGESRGVTICQEVCADSRGIMQWPLSMFGHPSPHHHSGIVRPRPASTQAKHTHTQAQRREPRARPLNYEGSLAHLCKLDKGAERRKKKEWENKQPYVRSMSNNIWSFVVCRLVFFFLPPPHFPHSPHTPTQEETFSRLS